MVLLSPGRKEFVIGGRPQRYPVVESLTVIGPQCGADENTSACSKVASQGEAGTKKTAFNLSWHQLPPHRLKDDIQLGQHFFFFFWSTSGVH